MKKSRFYRKTNLSCWFWGLCLVFLAFACITASLAFTTIKQAAASLDLGLLPPQLIISEPAPTPIQMVQQFLDVSVPLQPETGPPPQPWQGESRLTILLFGVDSRNGEAGDGPSLTDTIILVTLDPKTQMLGVLSIPRDLWVEVPGYGYYKINQAYLLGEADHIPGGGPGLAMATVGDLLDIDIPFYALVDFKAFVHLIDKIGGVPIDIPESIEVDTLGDSQNITLEPGLQILNGDLALAYARARNSEGGDFDRAHRQQDVMMSVREQVISIDFLPTLLSEAPILYQEVADGVKTNLSLQQVIQLVWLAVQIPPENIRQGVIGPDQVVFGTSYQGWDILQPIPEEIFALRDQIFDTEPSLVVPAVEALDEEEKVAGENARIELRNGTFTAGLAAQTGSFLQEDNLNVISISNADQIYANSAIIVYTGKPYTTAYLSKILHVPQSRVFHRFDPESEVDLLVILGEDWAQNNDLP